MIASRALAALALVVFLLAPAQGGSDEKFTENAGPAFAAFAVQARAGYFGQKEICQNLVNQYHLSRKNGGESVDGWWGLWQGGNTTGQIATYAGFPDVMNKAKNHFWVRFDVPTETPMPQALLSHLLGKARETAVTGGDMLEIRLPYEQVLGGCMESYTLTVRITTGALVSNAVEDYCPAK